MKTYEITLSITVDAESYSKAIENIEKVFPIKYIHSSCEDKSKGQA